MNFDDFLSAATNLNTGLLLLTHRSSTPEVNLMDISNDDFEERLQMLLSERSNVIQPTRASITQRNVDDSAPLSIECEGIMRFCDEYRVQKSKLDEISDQISQINENKKIINTALEIIQKHLYDIIKLSNNDEDILKLYKSISDDVYNMYSKTNEIVCVNEPSLLAEQQKISDYIYSCINLLSLVKKDIASTSDAPRKVTEADEKSNRLSCPVCYDNEVNTVYIPCGHTICMPCCKKVKGSTCIICRKTAAAIPFYLSS
jgi:archaellum component FlaC